MKSFLIFDKTSTAFVLVFFIKNRDLFGHFSKQKLSGFQQSAFRFALVKAKDKT